MAKRSRAFRWKDFITQSVIQFLAILLGAFLGYLVGIQVDEHSKQVEERNEVRSVATALVEELKYDLARIESRTPLSTTELLDQFFPEAPPEFGSLLPESTDLFLFPPMFSTSIGNGLIASGEIAQLPTALQKRISQVYTWLQVSGASQLSAGVPALLESIDFYWRLTESGTEAADAARAIVKGMLRLQFELDAERLSYTWAVTTINDVISELGSILSK